VSWFFVVLDCAYEIIKLVIFCSQTLLGKTRLIPIGELMDVGSGFLSDSARNIIIELQMNNAVTYYEKSVDISPGSRTRKNATGHYFDTSTFSLAGFYSFCTPCLSSYKVM